MFLCLSHILLDSLSTHKSRARPGNWNFNCAFVAHATVVPQNVSILGNQLLIRKPLILPLQQNLLSLPFSDRRHPLRDRLRLTACLLSGRRCDSKAFQDQLPRLSLHPGEPVQGNATNRHLGSGFTSVLGERLIRFEQM